MKLGLSLGIGATGAGDDMPYIIIRDNGDGTMTASASSGTLSDIRWQSGGAGSWADIPGATSATYDRSGDPDGTQYRVLADIGLDDLTSNTLIKAAAVIAPALSVAPSLSDTSPRPGATVTITEGTYTGTPAPTISGTLTLDGVDVSGDMVGADYTVPTGTHGEALVWSETATNAAGSDGPNTATVTVTADAPTFNVTNQSVVTGVGPFTLDLATFVSDDGGDGSITYGLTPQAGVSLAGSVLTFTDSVGTYSGVAVSATNAGGTTNDTFNFEITSAATAPAQFGSGDWSVASGDTQATVTITALPSDGGAAITAIEYQLDGGSWVDSGRTTTGAFTITGLTNLTEYDVALRAVNAVGAGTASATKPVTPAEGTLSLGYDPDGTAIVGLIDGTDVIITISGEAGSPFTVPQASLSDGFHILGTADVTGTDGVGNTWTAVVPLHVYTTAEGAPVITYQWVDADDTPISGATSATYVQQAGDDADGLSVIMTFSNGNGTVGTAEADAIVPPPPASAVVSGYTGTMIETEDATYYYKTLTTDGTLTFSAGGTIDGEFIGGGAGGGARKGGGGGAGARVVQTGITVGATNYVVTIGAGGAGAVYTVSDSTDGGTTTFDAAGFNYQAGGGGKGGSFGFVTEGGDAPATIGGGGGGSRYGLSTEGVSNGAGVLGGDGGLDSTGALNVGGGGGGGMGGDGGDAAVGVVGTGGAGVTSYLGDTVCIGGDGGHETVSAPSTPTAAGSGGDGGGPLDPNRSGTDGAPGRVVIRIAK